MSTKYTQSERTKISKALRAAKHFLWDGKESATGRQQMICFCIDMANNRGLIDVRCAGLAQKMIMSRLEGNAGMTRFLRDHGIPADELTNERVQAHRLAWLNMLIEEFSAE